MLFGVGFSDNPDTSVAGVQAAGQALRAGPEVRGCDLVMLFSTSRHDAKALREAVQTVIGPNVPIVGGGSIGIITHDQLGYAGDQVGLAAIWFEGADCDIIVQDGLRDGEAEAGEALAGKLKAAGVTPDSQIMLFYDAIDRTGGGVRLLMATPFLNGLKETLGFMPNLVGAGLQGDYASTPIQQWLGDRMGEHSLMAMVFKNGVRIDSAIMHGCKPSTGYYTVTKAEKQTILEIDGQPALHFIHEKLGQNLPVESYPFFLIFGINQGDKWGKFNETDYANRLCLAIDKDRNGIVMFEPDMVEGTQFQIMQRSLDLDYIQPKINNLFDNLGNRKPVFGFYIDCAGRAAGYAGTDLEDAETVQQAVAGRAPLLGIYSGVEIAPVTGEARALDWTGVFCLLSVAE
ncbi:MAG: FIST C-terminal domain-containing protein [Planctomycetes bacterium]|nr:FIST C-terminal domain-containing protein [Planctomycetota bacterium]